MPRFFGSKWSRKRSVQDNAEIFYNIHQNILPLKVLETLPTKYFLSHKIKVSYVGFLLSQKQADLFRNDNSLHSHSFPFRNFWGIFKKYNRNLLTLLLPILYIADKITEAYMATFERLELWICFAIFRAPQDLTTIAMKILIVKFFSDQASSFDL